MNSGGGEDELVKTGWDMYGRNEDHQNKVQD
jgi:hypothetical protein